MSLSRKIASYWLEAQISQPAENIHWRLPAFLLMPAPKEGRRLSQLAIPDEDRL
jgi:hypothetical protein